MLVNYSLISWTETKLIFELDLTNRLSVAQADDEDKLYISVTKPEFFQSYSRAVNITGNFTTSFVVPP